MYETVYMYLILATMQHPEIRVKYVRTVLHICSRSVQEMEESSPYTPGCYIPINTYTRCLKTQSRYRQHEKYSPIRVSSLAQLQYRYSVPMELHVEGSLFISGSPREKNPSFSLSCSLQSNSSLVSAQCFSLSPLINVFFLFISLCFFPVLSYRSFPIQSLREIFPSASCVQL